MYIWHSYRSYKIISRVSEKAPAPPFAQPLSWLGEQRKSCCVLERPTGTDLLNQGSKGKNLLSFSSPQPNMKMVIFSC